MNIASTGISRAFSMTGMYSSLNSDGQESHTPPMKKCSTWAKKTVRTIPYSQLGNEESGAREVSNRSIQPPNTLKSSKAIATVVMNSSKFAVPNNSSVRGRLSRMMPLTSVR